MSFVATGGGYGGYGGGYPTTNTASYGGYGTATSTQGYGGHGGISYGGGYGGGYSAPMTTPGMQTYQAPMQQSGYGYAAPRQYQAPLQTAPSMIAMPTMPVSY